jgi:hypothetical protein
MRILLALLACASLLTAGDHGKHKDKHKNKHRDRGEAHERREDHEGDRDGHHGRYGRMPPGLAKKFGRVAPARPYIAVDPRYRDRAWFLIDGRWQLRQGLNLGIQAEIQDVLRMPLAPPPVPLPKVGVDLHVVLFN